MRVVGGVLVGALLVGILSGIVWYTRYRPAVLSPAQEVKQQQDRQEGRRAAEENDEKRKEEYRKVLEKDITDAPPPISASGPYPKAVTAERHHEFGTMAKDEQRKHKFTIRNDGEVPLLLSKGPTTCKCTISDLPVREVAPGGSTEVEISWTPRDLDPQFRKEARIQTNDPDNREIRFLITGKVVSKFVVTPSAEWNIGIVAEGATGETFSTIASPLYDQFKILGVDNDNPLLTVEFTPLDAERLKKLDAKSGYEFKTHLSAGIHVGPFTKKLKVRTDIDGGTVVDIVIRAMRPGPLRFLPAIGGAQWHGEEMSLNLGRFPASGGKTAYLPLFISGMKEDFKLLGFESSVDFLAVTLDADAEEGAGAKKNKLYRLKFAIPPGSPPIARTSNDPAHVKLKTNHPQAGEIELEVVFVSQ